MYYVCLSKRNLLFFCQMHDVYMCVCFLFIYLLDLSIYLFIYKLFIYLLFIYCIIVLSGMAVSSVRFRPRSSYYYQEQEVRRSLGRERLSVAGEAQCRRVLVWWERVCGRGLLLRERFSVAVHLLRFIRVNKQGCQGRYVCKIKRFVTKTVFLSSSFID